MYSFCVKPSSLNVLGVVKPNSTLMSRGGSSTPSARRPATTGHDNAGYQNFHPSKEIPVSELHTTLEVEKQNSPESPFQDEFNVSSSIT